MAIYYVAPDGNDGNDGSSGAPWRTIGQAMSANLQPGDEVVVRPGTYEERVFIEQDGAPGNHITLRSEIPGQAFVRPPDGTYSTINIRGNYVTVEGFDVVGGDGHAIDGERVHNVIVRDNIAHDSGGSGISFYLSEFQTIENNVVYGNAATNGFHTSGISIASNLNLSGDTTFDGFRTIVRGNVSHSNKEITVPGDHTDGNGIIIDWMRNEGTGFPPYDYPALVENNLVYNNGGKGIQVFRSDNVTVRNNTSYHNNTDLQAQATARGELSNQSSDGSTWINNIAVANPNINPFNTAIGDYDGYNTGTTWFNNITFNGTPGDPSLAVFNGNEPPTAADGNILGVDPRFVDSANGDFRLLPDSPAINAGTAAFGLSEEDLAGNDRTIGPVDIGAFELLTAAAIGNGTPVLADDDGFSTASGARTVIAAADLLANDSDPDGDALDLIGVSNASGGSASLTGNGDVSFTPAAGFAGTARFTYTVSDGNGGTGSARVSVEVAGAAPVNALPDARDDGGFSTDAGAALRIAPSALLANDVDPDGDTLSIAGVSDAVGGTVRLASDGDVVFTPADGFSGDGGFSYAAVDADGASDTATVTVTVAERAAAPAPVAPGEGLWDDTETPAVLFDWDPNAVQLGTRFTAEVSGTVSGVSFYRGEGALAADEVRLWTDTGELLASASTADGTTTGWLDVAFDAPVAVQAGESFVASYHAPNGQYVVSENYFTAPYSTGELSVPADGGVYVYGSSSGFPNQTYQGSNYWVDVMFTPEANAGAGAPATAGGGSGTASGVFATYGTADVNHEWATVSYDGDFSDPVVIAFDMTGRGPQPAEPRIRNVDPTANTFDIALTEPEYLDGRHLTETVSWMVVESGTFELADGTVVTAGRVDTGQTVDEGMVDVAFDHPFAETPHLFSTVNSVNGTDWVTTRHADVTTGSFGIALQEEEARGPHPRETIGFLAVSNGSSGGPLRSISLTDDPLPFDAPATFFADMQTTNGRDTAVVRANGEDGTLFIQEEQSADAETNHVAEEVSVLGFEASAGQVEGVEVLA